uniref:Uncharacterized protein n=1 Tax=Pyramimonas obovata TaxID=1411642 RepID=A0A7S0WJG9_9CHLO
MDLKLHSSPLLELLVDLPTLIRKCATLVNELNDAKRGVSDRRSEWYRLSSSLLDFCEPIEVLLVELQIKFQQTGTAAGGANAQRAASDAGLCEALEHLRHALQNGVEHVNFCRRASFFTLSCQSLFGIKRKFPELERRILNHLQVVATISSQRNAVKQEGLLELLTERMEQLLSPCQQPDMPPMMESLKTAVTRRLQGDTSWNVQDLLAQLQAEVHISPDQMAQELQQAFAAAGGIDLSAKEELYITQVISLLESVADHRATSSSSSSSSRCT